MCAPAVHGLWRGVHPPRRSPRCEAPGGAAGATSRSSLRSRCGPLPGLTALDDSEPPPPASACRPTFPSQQPDVTRGRLPRERLTPGEAVPWTPSLRSFNRGRSADGEGEPENVGEPRRRWGGSIGRAAQQERRQGSSGRFWEWEPRQPSVVEQADTL